MEIMNLKISSKTNWRMWSSCVVTVNGEVVPCCFDKDAKYQLGKLKQKFKNHMD